ncbi:nuclear body protein SP140-like [Phalaenopsis equestris]|uniref:nuclear body protein SP140-like n=1 Tax=Phalaenopsis equestris TaxID=78828 RepID=UPI0009E21369|nr:nuclear body protein SP140-like [Phalaenopsis equestris]
MFVNSPILLVFAIVLTFGKQVSPSQFEAHAGHSQRRKPYNYIYTSNGVSLHELSVTLSKRRKLLDSENDDLCSICEDAGELVLCDLCPRAFHQGIDLDIAK